jgi:hypothetical protein
MKPTKILFFALFLSFQSLFSQGSGDTNISLYGNIAPQFEREENYFIISSHTRIDQGKNGVFSIAPYVCLSTDVNDQLDFQLWITSKHASGDLTSGFALGDISFIGAYHFSESYTDQTIDFGLISSITGGKGLKKASNSTYTTFQTYPMEYQSTLGTIDIFVGYTLKTDKINFSAGYQMPITSKNQNNFFPKYFELGDFNENYPPSNEMKRSANFYSRAGYFIVNESDFLVNVGATAFYKLKNDQFYDANKNGYNVGYNEVDGTKGLALNGVVQLNYKIYNELEVSLYAGLPLVDRKVYIDGLKRDFFVTPGLIWNF